MGTKHRGPAEEVRALDAYVKLSRAAAAVEAAVNRHLAAAGLTISQFGVLEALWHLGPLSQGALAKKILKSPANLTTVLDNLERRELIRRRRDPSDRRVVRVELTDRGDAGIAPLFPLHVTRVVDAFSALDPAEQETLARLCRTLGLAQGEPVQNEPRQRGPAQDARIDHEPTPSPTQPTGAPRPRKDAP
jgi:MarR family 2-MHQ and catechol resistance regulon transcriptional repressor